VTSAPNDAIPGSVVTRPGNPLADPLHRVAIVRTIRIGEERDRRAGDALELAPVRADFPVLLFRG